MSFLNKNGLLYVLNLIKTDLNSKVSKVSGKGLSTNDYTTTDKNKLSGIAAGAEANVQSDWNISDTDSDAFIKNKPSSLPANGGNSTTVNGHTVNSDVPNGAKFTDTVYTHPNSGVTAGVYKSVTVNAQGHVTGGSNPTTLSGYGITDAATKTQGGKADTAVQSVKIGTTEYKNGTNVVLPAYPTTLPASDVSAWAKASTKPTYTKSEVGLGNVENKSSATIRSEITKSNVTTALGYTPYTPNEVDNKLSALETNIDWKESVATYDDIATTYQNPVDGWTVNVKDTDYTYRYNGTSWVAISANAIPKATNSVDGLLSKEDHTKYEDANSKKHTHSNKSVVDGITSTLVSNWNSAKTHADSTHARTDATKVESSTTNGNIKINGTETKVYTHPSGTNPHGTTKSDVGLGNVPNVATNDQTPTFTEATTLAKLTSGEKLSVVLGKISKSITDLISHIGDSVKHITNSERTLWNTVGNKVDKVSGKGLSTNDYTTTEKNKLAGIATGANAYSLPLSSSSVRGGAKIGYTANGKNYPVQLSNEQMYVNVPWTDTNTTYGAGTASVPGLTKLYTATGSATDGAMTQKSITDALVGKASTSHNHTKSQITDFPSSMPASDVYSWAKASTKPSYAWSEITGKPSTFAPSSHTHNYAGSSSVGGSANTAVKLATQRSIAISGGVTGTATNFDGSGNISIPVTSINEAYLTWGGKNFAGSYGCIDAAMVPELGANRLAFMPAAAIQIQYSTNGGSTWSNYSTSDSGKIDLFNGNGSNYTIGGSLATNIDKSKYQLRVTIDTGIAAVYTQLNKFCIYCTTSGSSGCWCTIDAKTKADVDSGTDTWLTCSNKATLNGWSGYNIINTSYLTTYGNSSYQYQKVRFTFGVDSHPSSTAYPGLTIIKIMGFGGVGWNTPSTMAKYGRIYTYDSEQNVTFPAKVTATTFSGNATTATTAGHVVLQSGNEFNLIGNDNIGTLWLNYKNPSTGNNTTKAITSYSFGNGQKGTSGVTLVASSFSGNSATATALTTSAGSATQPVYFSGGKPVACTHTLGKSVPSNAVFTDTTYTLSSITGTLAVAKGGTGSTTSSGARSNLGASNVVCQSSEPTSQNVGDLWLAAE